MTVHPRGRTRQVGLDQWSRPPVNWYDVPMSEQPSGALTPTYSTEPAQWVNPSRVIDAQSVVAHNFFNTLREITRNYRHWPTENHKLAAIESVNAYEKHTLNGRVSDVVTEDDHAPVEDVSKRRPPPGSGLPVNVVQGPAIDYNKLAAALAEHMQRAQVSQSPSEGEHESS